VDECAPQLWIHHVGRSTGGQVRQQTPARAPATVTAATTTQIETVTVVPGGAACSRAHVHLAGTAGTAGTAGATGAAGPAANARKAEAAPTPLPTPRQQPAVKRWRGLTPDVKQRRKTLKQVDSAANEARARPPPDYCEDPSGAWSTHLRAPRGLEHSPVRTNHDHMSSISMATKPAPNGPPVYCGHRSQVHKIYAQSGVTRTPRVAPSTARMSCAPGPPRERLDGMRDRRDAPAAGRAAAAADADPGERRAPSAR
jgi:hypothetical protein